MQTLGYVEAEGRLFRLTPKILDLGFAYLTSMPFWNLAEPVMEGLSAQVHESCSAAVLDRTEIVYVLRVPTHKIMTINLSIGSRLPAYCTSMGRVLLAALDDETLEATLNSAPLYAHTPRTVTDKDELKKADRAGAPPRLGDRRSGTGRRSDFAVRADPQSPGARDRGDEHQRQCAAQFGEADGEGISGAAAAGCANGVGDGGAARVRDGW